MQIKFSSFITELFMKICFGIFRYDTPKIFNLLFMIFWRS